MSIVPRRAVRVALTFLAVSVTTLSVWAVGPASAATAEVKINEVESNGGTPGDWAELYNPGPGAADVSGFVFKDNDDSHSYTLPSGSTIAAGGYLVLDEAAFGFGLGSADSARLFRPDTSVADLHSWTSHAATTYGRCPDGSGAFATTVASTKGAANNCTVVAAPVRINEVESSGGTPGDWVELYNPNASPAAVGGFVFKDNDDSHNFTIPAGTTIAGGGYLVLDEASFGFGLGNPDSARLFDASAALVDSHAWTSHASTTYGRCPNGTGAFATTTASTKGAVNACAGDAVYLPWPGGPDVATADGTSVFGGNMSGLAYEGSGTATPGVLWGARNGPGTLFRLVFNGTIWTPDTTADWGAGKALRYPNGTGNPDAEGVTFAESSATGGIYVSTERNNDANGVSRNAILRFDPTAAGPTLTATNEWDLTADLPTVGANLGMEAITWVPDSVLVAQGFRDESKGHAYAPAEYTNHGTGLFFVGLESAGTIYAYALDHVGGGYTRVATIDSTQLGVMDLQFDRDLQELWSVCDDGCQGRAAVLRIASATGKFTVAGVFDRPAGMANLNNEGFAIAAATECVDGRKPAFWADDSETSGHSIRRGTVSCTSSGGPSPVIPEFPAAAIPTVMAAALIGGWSLLRRRRRLTI